MKIAFTSAGAPRHGKNLQAQVQRLADKAGYGWETTFWEWKKDGYESYDLASIDWLWNVGQFGNFFQWLEQANPRPKTIAMWIGTDILQHNDIVRKGIPDPFEDAPANVSILPEISGDAKLGEMVSCFAYLRPCQHDGIGLTLIEMAQLGRYVFHSDTRIPHVLPIRSAGEAEFHLDRILERKQPPNPEAGKYYVREYSESALADDLDRLRKRMEGPGRES